MEFKNNNGRTYTIIETKGDYTLLEQQNGGYEPFIVAWDLNIERGDWSKGRYHKTLEQATEVFNQLTK